MTTSAEGGCLCGAVRYRASGPMVVGTLCHCRSCRLASGAPSVGWACFATKDFAFIRGEPVAYASSPGVERTFCGRCGTPLTYRKFAEGRTVDVTTATLDDPDAFAPTKEIWVGEKLGWECTNSAMWQFAQSSTGD
jgi:hypothetical protein